MINEGAGVRPGCALERCNLSMGEPNADCRVRISVVVPAYNVERFVGDALASVFNQSVPFCEVIIIDDGSTDGTAREIDRACHGQDVVVLRTANCGLSAARNLGASKVTGDYIYFFDADDVLPSTFVEEISATLLENGLPDLLAFSGQAFLDGGNHQWVPAYDRAISGAFDTGWDAFAALMCHDSFFSSACLYISKAGMWRTGLNFRPIVHEDEEIILRLFALASKTVVSNARLFQRRVRADSIMTSSISLGRAEGIRTALTSTLKLLALQKLTNPVHKRAARRRVGQLIRNYVDLAHASGARIDRRQLLVDFVRNGNWTDARAVFKLLVPQSLLAVTKRLKGCMVR